MKAMKTVEEMRDDVLAECEAVCPDRDFPANADWGHLMFGYVKYDGDDYEAWFLYVSASIHPISLYARSADQVWLAAYRLLGLSERDAVEDEKSRLLKRYKARIKRLRANDAETHRIQIEVKDEKMAALEAKEHAEKALIDKQSDIDYAKATVELAQAVAQLQAISKLKKRLTGKL